MQKQIIKSLGISNENEFFPEHVNLEFSNVVGRENDPQMTIFLKWLRFACFWLTLSLKITTNVKRPKQR